MFKISLKSSDTNFLNEIKNLSENLQEKAIKNGLDKSLEQSLQKLKKDLNYIVNNRIRDIDAKPGKDTLGNEKIILPKSDQEMLKQLFNVDVGAINKTKDFTSTINEGVILVNESRVRLRVPISPDADFDQEFNRASDFLKTATFAFKIGNEVIYIKNPGIDLSQYLKLVCSTDTGDSKKSRTKFDHYKNSNIMTRQFDSNIGRYAEWSLKQEAVKRMLTDGAGFINLTHVIKKIKEGDFDEAENLSQGIKDQNTKNKILEQIKKIKNDENVKPSTKNYLNLIKLINTLKFEKTISQNVVKYTLVANYTPLQEKELSEVEVFDKIKQELTLWLASNSNIWFAELSTIIDNILDKLTKGTR